MVELVGIGSAHWIDNTEVVDSPYGQNVQKGQNADSVVQNLYKILGAHALSTRPKYTTDWRTNSDINLALNPFRQ